MLVRLVGGPADGMLYEVERGQDKLTVANWWTYTFAGKKEGGHQLFCIMPRSRRLRRMILWYIGEYGKHPGLEPKPKPYRRDRAGKS